MRISGRKWFLEIIEAEGRAVAFLGTDHPATGTVVWDTVDGISVPAQWTERDILDELYIALMRLMEVRA